MGPCMREESASCQVAEARDVPVTSAGSPERRQHRLRVEPPPIDRPGDEQPTHDTRAGSRRHQDARATASRQPNGGSGGASSVDRSTTCRSIPIVPRDPTPREGQIFQAGGRALAVEGVVLFIPSTHNLRREMSRPMHCAPPRGPHASGWNAASRRLLARGPSWLHRTHLAGR